MQGNPPAHGAPSLQGLIPPGMFVGTSLILRRAGRYLYGMRPARQEQERRVIEITGIGGGIEPVDETYAAGALREAAEEIGCGRADGAACRVNLISCERTLVVRGQSRLDWVKLVGLERPAALVFRYHRTPPHRPWDGRNEGRGWIIVYLADLEGCPSTTLELPWLLWMSPEQVLATARNDVLLRHLVEAGAELVLGSAGSPPESSWARLTDSQEALGLALGDALPWFFQALG